MTDDYIISQEMANNLIEYLMTQPYGEVAEFIEQLRKLPKKV